MSIFKGASTMTTRKTVSDKIGYIRALLSDLGNEGDGILYDDWISLVPLLKFEIEDEDIAFEIFDEFSCDNEHYDESFTYKKFYEAQLEGDGRITLGTLIHIVKENLGDEYDYTKYAKYFSDEAVSKIEEFNKKIKRNKNKMPDHYLPEAVEKISFPENAKVDHVLALTTVLVEGQTYGTACDPRQCHIIDPFAGDRIEQYITVNPVKDSRKQANVTDFRYSVLEFDTISLDEQFSLLNAIDLPYEALIFTGNKSIHAWIRIDAPDLDTYRKRTRLIAKMLSDFGYNKEKGNGPDTAVLFDCASLVRSPGSVRTDWSNKGDKSAGNMQQALWAEESAGWDDWYGSVYPKYVLESSLSEVDEEVTFEVPDKEHNFVRVIKKVKEQYGADYDKPLCEGLAGLPPEEIQKALLENIPEFFVDWCKKNRKKQPLTIESLYHLFIDACREGGAHYEGDIQEALYNACVNAHRYVAAQFAERKARAVENVEDLISIDFEDSDPLLLEAIDKEIYKASNSEKPEAFEMLEISLGQVAADMEDRPGVLMRPELHKYAEILGTLLSGEIENLNHLDYGSLYIYRSKVHFFDTKLDTLKPMEVRIFPFLIQPYVCCIKQDNKGLFSVAPLDNDAASKMLESYQFKSKLKNVEILSEVPVFKELSEGSELIMEYDSEKACLITKPVDNYGFMELDKAKGIILSLFDDFEFVDPSDKSRALAALLTPALCHADLLHGDFRPIYYIDADGQGAGKNTLADFMILPYTDNPAKVTQDDSSIGSIDDKLGFCVMSGSNLIILDNLKPTRKMKELSSPFIESLTTSNQIQYRAPGQQNATLNTESTCLYVTTNGMSMSKDLAQRSLYISIRKKPDAFNFKHYNGGPARWVCDNRPMIMSAIYTILKEYVSHGKPSTPLENKHRFRYSTPVLNYIVTEIFGLTDISSGMDKTMFSKSDPGIDIARSICFAFAKADKLECEVGLGNIDIFEMLQDQGLENILGLPYDMEIYSDEDNIKFSPEAKRAIGQKISAVMSKNQLLGRPNAKKEDTSCSLEEFIITRVFCPSNRQAKYIVRKK